MQLQYCMLRIYTLNLFIMRFCTSSTKIWTDAKIEWVIWCKKNVRRGMFKKVTSTLRGWVRKKSELQQ